MANLFLIQTSLFYEHFLSLLYSQISLSLQDLDHFGLTLCQIHSLFIAHHYNFSPVSLNLKLNSSLSQMGKKRMIKSEGEQLQMAEIMRGRNWRKGKRAGELAHGRWERQGVLCLCIFSSLQLVALENIAVIAISIPYHSLYSTLSQSLCNQREWEIWVMSSI